MTGDLEVAVEHHVAYDTPDAKGRTRRQRIKGEVTDPEIPAAGEHVWDWFWELDGQRSGSGFGGNPISFVEIGEWARLMRVGLQPWEVRALVVMDRARRGAAQTPDNGGPGVSPSNVEGVKALMRGFMARKAKA